jgi:hypothetical protein
LVAAAVILAFAAGVRAANALQGPVPPALATGATWKAYGSQEKQAYLSGFIAGTASEQVFAAAKAAGGAPDSAAVSSGAIAKLYAGKQLHFPYTPSVYSVQLDDFFWWTNHAETPIVDAMITTNRQMLAR